jgi:hypothetical protein
MAWFVLHPPVGVRVVSFFVTTRFASQSDRKVFLEVVLEQLAEVAGQSMPNVLTESNRQAWFGQLLHDAAVACHGRGQRLVLVVDGLDEDQGATSSPDAHSIAALLPAVPPAGMRVIVAGRPDPPVPADVPPWHPLRDKEIIRWLSISPHAQVLRDNAVDKPSHPLDNQELRRQLKVFLCHGSEDKQTIQNFHTRLKDQGFRPWLDEQDLVPGVEWEVVIRDAIRDSHVVLVCLSRTSIEKTGYVQKEIKFVLDRADEMPEGRIYLIPVRLEDCVIPRRLAKWQWVDLYSPDGYERLQHALTQTAERLG